MYRLHRSIRAVATIAAILGGSVLLATVILTCVSILGRTLGIGPVRGDVELVEAGIAFAIFAFLPLCQVTAGHATVDLFTNWLSGRAMRLLLFVIEAVFAATLIVIAVQLESGMQGRIRSGQTSFLLEFPLWWSYAASLAGASVAALAGVWMALARLHELATNRDLVGAAEAGS